MDWQVACQRSELSEQAPLLFCEVGGIPIIICLLSDGSIACYKDKCSHQDVRLSDFGRRHEDRLLCLAHGAIFELSTGAAIRGPACEGLESFETSVDKGEILVKSGEPR